MIDNFSGYANIFSLTNFPIKANVNEFAPITNTDTKDWRLDNTKLYCENHGTWNIILQYQLIGVLPSASALESSISGFVNINGENVEYSSATGYAARVGAKNVLTIAFTYNFKDGDYFSIGVYADNNNPESDIPNTICAVNKGGSSITDPSIIVTATKMF